MTAGNASPKVGEAASTPAAGQTLPYRERVLLFDSNGLRLVGVLSESAGEGTARASIAVVLIHGWGSYRSGPHAMLVKMARALAAAGICAIRFDVRGRGDSEGDYAETDLDGMIADTVAAGKVLQKETGCRRLAAVGLCSGGNVAIGAATLLPAFEKLVPISTLPFQSHKKASQERRRTLAALGSYARKVFRPETWRKLMRGEINFGLVKKAVAGSKSTRQRADSAAGGQTRNLKDSARDIVAEFARYAGEILFVYGGADAEGAAGRRHYETFCREHDLGARFHVIEGANHNYYSLAWERELMDRTMQFVTL